MAIYKNKASQKVAVFAVDADGAAKTGDAANITAQISLDGAACAATNDTNPTELDATDAPGIYLFDLTQAETNANLIVLAADSSTSGVVLRPVVIYTEPEVRDADAVKLGGTNQTGRDIGASVLLDSAYDAAKIGAGPVFAVNPPIEHSSTSNILRLYIAAKSGSGGYNSLAYNTANLSIAVRPSNDEGTPPKFMYDSGDSEIEAISAIGTYQAPSAGCCRFGFASPSGCYELHLADAVFAEAGATGLTVYVSGGADWQESLLEVPLVGYDPQNVAEAGDAMTLADDAITAAKFDESTAFPLKSADTGATAVARTGADSDTLKTLSDEIAAQASELTKVPKSDGSTSWNDTALAAVAAEVEETLDSNWQMALWGDDWYDQRAAHWFTNGGVRMIWGGQTDGSDIGDVSGGNPLAAFPAGSFGKKVDDYLNYSIYSVASSVSSVLAKLGGWAGTTTDTILGAFQALFKKSGATTPADLGTVFDPATDSLPAVYDKVAALPAASDIKTALEAAGSYLEAIKAKTDNLPTDPADDSDIDAAIAALKTILDKLDTAMELDGAVYKFTKNALEDAPSGGGDDAATVAAAVWEEAKTDHTTAGTYGAYLDMAISSIGTGTGDIAFTYTMTEDDEVTPISGVTVKVSTDSDGASMIRQGITDADGEVVFNMDAGTRYFWRYKDGYYFDNPDIEVVSEDA